jgi:hypothetical protein
MNNKQYNLIIHGDPKFWSDNKGYVDFPKDRFLEYTENHLKNQFQSLDQNAIEALKTLPTLFAVEHENSDTRIGIITSIEVQSKYLRIYYKFSENRYPLTRGVLQKNWQKLNIEKTDYEFYRTHWAIKECDIPDFYEGYLKTLTGISHRLKGADKKVQLIYGFNGMGKTRLSRKFKDLVAPKTDNDDEAETTQPKVIYYNAFTEDLFYWDNDLEGDTNRKLKIQHNAYTRWVLQEQGQDLNAIAHFQRYTSDKLTPRFNEEYKIKDKDGKEITVPAFSEVTFSFERGNEERSENVKISKAEESNFIWSIFYSLIKQVISTLNIAEASERDTDRYDQLEYVFVDDPVSSLDENHLIELAVDLAGLIKSSQSDLKFIITTHSPLFYNVLCNEFQNDDKNFGYKAKRFEKYRFAPCRVRKNPRKNHQIFHLFKLIAFSFQACVASPSTPATEQPTWNTPKNNWRTPCKALAFSAPYTHLINIRSLTTARYVTLLTKTATCGAVPQSTAVSTPTRR